MKIREINICIATGMILSLTIQQNGEAGNLGKLISPINKNNFLLIHTWNTQDDIVLSCIVIRKSSKSGPSESKLEIIKNNKLIFSFTPHAAPLSIYSLSELDSRLVTTWVNGSGTYLLDIFSFLDGKVVKVLDVASKMLPEFVYSATTPGNYEQRIIISSIDWITDPDSGSRIQLPAKADIYVWDKNFYKLYKSVPWKERLYVK